MSFLAPSQRSHFNMNNLRNYNLTDAKVDYPNYPGYVQVAMVRDATIGRRKPYRPLRSLLSKPC